MDILLYITNMFNWYVNTMFTNKIFLIFFLLFTVILFVIGLRRLNIFFIVICWLVVYYLIFGQSQIFTVNDYLLQTNIQNNITSILDINTTTDNFKLNIAQIYQNQNKTNISVNKQTVFTDDLSLGDLSDV